MSFGGRVPARRLGWDRVDEQSAVCEPGITTQRSLGRPEARTFTGVARPRKSRHAETYVAVVCFLLQSWSSPRSRTGSPKIFTEDERHAERRS
jgi:hypothetical protein